jgi:hypothetical protein
MLVDAHLKQPITMFIKYATVIHFITNSEYFEVVYFFKHTSKCVNVSDDCHYPFRCPGDYCYILDELFFNCPLQ